MILDNTNLFSEDQAITADAASTNVIDLGADRNIGVGTPVPILIQVTEDFDNLTSLTIQVQTSSAENFGSATTLVSVTVVAADLVAGYKAPIIHLPRGIDRYLRLNYDVTGTAPEAGKITAAVVMGVQDGF